MTEKSNMDSGQQEQQLFRSYLDKLPLEVMITERTGGVESIDTIKYLNPAFKNLLPAQGKDFIGADPLIVFRPSADDNTTSENLTDGIQKLEVSDYKNEIRHLFFEVISSTEGERTVHIWTRINIGEPDKKVHTGINLETHFSEIFRNNDEIVLCFTLNSDVSYFNESFARHTGLQDSDLVGKPATSIISGEDENTLEEAFESARQGIARDLLVSVRARNGNETWFQSSIVPVTNSSDEAVAVYLIGREATLLQLKARHELLLNEITGIFRQEVELKSALAQVLALLCRKFGWEAGEFWLPDQINRRIKLFSNHYPDGKAFEELSDVSHSEQISAEIEHSITTSSGKPLLHKASHLFLNDNFPRRNYVNKAGLDQGFSVPVYSGDQLSAVLIFFASGKERGFSKDLLFFCRELALRIGVYIQLHRLRHDYNQMFELVPDFLCILNANGRFYEVNRHLQEVLGVDEAEIKNRSIISFVPDEYQEEMITKIQEVKSAGTVSFEIALTGKLNELLTEWSFSYNKDEQVIYVAGKDVSLRQKYDLEFRKNSERFELLSEAISDVIYEWDIKNGKFIWGNSFQRIFGHENPESYNTLEAAAQFIHEADKNRVQSNVNAALLRKDRIWTDEYRYRCADGTYKSVLDRGVLIYDEKGRMVRMFGAMQDLTMLKESEETLIRLNDALQLRARQLQGFNKELEQFAYIVSHDLQEPLRMISSFMQLLKSSDDIEKSEKAEQYIDFAIDGSFRMKRLIQDLLTYSRVGTTEEDFQEVDLNVIMHDTSMVYQQQIRDKQAEIKVGNLPKVKAIYSLIGQLFDNLLSNALKYNQSGKPTIEVTASESNTHHIICFSDNGIGIDPRHFDTIYLPFKRLHNKNEYSGTGIGLAVCKKIAEKHFGSMWVESKPGEGSSFYFSIQK
ncbi:MAG: PAS domain S-box protein [Bacteroidia bacterium]